MKRTLSLFVCLLIFGINAAFGQDVQLKGTVTTSEDGSPLPGVYVKIVGTNTGTATDANGNYQLMVPSNASLLFTSIGFTNQEVAVAGQTVLNVIMEPDVTQVDEIVVTALGISREKKSLGYATQEVKGDQIAAVKTDNFINSLSGKVSGVQVKKTTNIGGSTNIVVRGNKSLTGSNQALFVVDGVPLNNEIANSTSQSQSGSGYDYGNAASDINPDDIESVNILKGAAATALYGSRASNGVVMITTKKGSSSKRGLGISINSSFSVGFVDKSTFPEYQTQYGGGYGKYYEDPVISFDPDDASTWGYWYMRDMDNNGTKEQWAVTSEDASYGAAFDPSLMIYQWDAVDPESPNYNTATPWVAAKNGPITFFENPVTYVNTIALDNGNEKGSYRISYTNYKQDGLLPNSELNRHNILFNGNYKVSDKLIANGSANFIRTSALGRNSTGYSDNIMGSFRQWFQTNVDIKDQKDAYFRTGRNITWNWADPSDAEPIFWDNPYWTRYENYETDSRNRFVGYVSLNYKVAKWLDIFGRASTDFYNGLEEERRAIGSVPSTFGIGTGADGSTGRPTQESGYLRRDIAFSEYNYDLMANFNTTINENISIKGVLGTSIRKTNYSMVIQSTNGGLGIPDLYAIKNSKMALPYPIENVQEVATDGIYGSVSLGYKNTVFLDGTLRRDHSSTLPEKNNVYYYPSVSASLLFSELVKPSWLSFGKVRVNYAEVGSGAPFDYISQSYNVIIPLNSPMSSVKDRLNNPDLKPERTKSFEGGLEMYFLDRRVGFDLALYKTKTIDQILPLILSRSTGYGSMIINAGEVENKGVELAITATPVKMNDFSWDININYAKNRNEVISLYKDLKNLQLGSFQGGITINARVGEPYGAIQGTNFTYNENGQPLVSATSGQYLKTATSDNVIGNINPDWTGGILNTLRYKNLSFSFLIDIQKGGDIFSLDMYYGLATGLYKETAFTNDLGNPVRNTIANGGGMINPGVNPNGQENQTRIRTDRYGAFGYARGLPDVVFVYDASYIKLREVNLTYRIPGKIIQKTFIKDAAVSFIGSNLWIIDKNLPYADPESGLGAGNLQGYSTGSLPSTRDFTFSVKLNF
jgi:TonB-linked SusC/RagA family outer membrane protein